MLDIVIVKVILFTGPNCSLCDLAIDIVGQFNADVMNISAQIELQKTNIRESADLYHLYGARIPVLKRTDANDELGWPFTLESLVEFLK
ncbi:MAG: hypothetical protein ACI97K_001585 [Glaciecola sp.]